MSKRKTPKAPARKAPSRKAPAKKAVRNCGTAKAPTTFATVHGKEDLRPGPILGDSPLTGSEMAMGSSLADLCRKDPDPGPRPAMTNEDIHTATHMAASASMPFEAAVAQVLKLRYGWEAPQTVAIDLLPREPLLKGDWEMGNRALSQTASASYNYSGPAPVQVKPTRTLPEHVFDLRRDLDSTHALLRQLVFTLEPVLTVGPKAMLFRRYPHPVNAKADDHDARRDSELTCSLECIDNSVSDLQTIVAHLIGAVALPFREDPDSASPATVD